MPLASLPNPLTIDEISALRSRLSYRMGRFMYQNLNKIFIISFLLMIFPMGACVISEANVSIVTVSSVIFLLTLVGMSACALMGNHSDINTIEDVLPQDCQELLNQLQSVPGGNEYREKLIEQGRAFTYHDVRIVQAAHDAWQQQQHEDEASMACKNLYGIGG